MSPGLRWPAAALVSMALGLAPPAVAQSPPPPRPSPPPPSPSPRPISDSVERVVERLEAQKKDPCREAKAQGRPCFPVETVIKGPEVSVRGSLGVPPGDKRPAPGGAPTITEMGPYRPGPPTRVSPHVTFDPGCVGKSVLKALKGKNDTYYLYRIRDTHGERVSLYDRKLEPKTFQGDLELIGRFTGECDALAAYRREEARTASPAPGPSATPSASPSPGPS